jgi:hypothetical protein
VSAAADGELKRQIQLLPKRLNSLILCGFCGKNAKISLNKNKFYPIQAKSLWRPADFFLKQPELALLSLTGISTEAGNKF